MTKTERSYFDRWKKSEITELHQIYSTYSKNKERAFEYCKEMCYRLQGFRFRIISHNTDIFTVGFAYGTSDNLRLRVMTPYHDYDFKCGIYNVFEEIFFKNERK